MRNLILGLLLIPITSCIDKFKDIKVAELKEDEKLVLIASDFTFDGNRENFCDVGNQDSYNNYGLELLAIDEAEYGRLLMFTSNRDEVIEDAVGCWKTGFLYNKARRKNIEPGLKFKPDSGKITYPGTIVVDWESEGFAHIFQKVSEYGFRCYPHHKSRILTRFRIGK